MLPTFERFRPASAKSAMSRSQRSTSKTFSFFGSTGPPWPVPYPVSATVRGRSSDAATQPNTSPLLCHHLLAGLYAQVDGVSEAELSVRCLAQIAERIRGFESRVGDR